LSYPYEQRADYRERCAAKSPTELRFTTEDECRHLAIGDGALPRPSSSVGMQGTHESITGFAFAGFAARGDRVKGLVPVVERTIGTWICGERGVPDISKEPEPVKRVPHSSMDRAVG
jgi:hypothetical protein